MRMEIMFKEENSGIFSGTGARAWVLHYEEPEKKQDREDAEEDVLAAAADTADTDPEDIRVSVPEIPTDWKGERITSSILMNPTTMMPYPAFLTKERTVTSP